MQPCCRSVSCSAASTSSHVPSSCCKVQHTYTVYTVPSPTPLGLGLRGLQHARPHRRITASVGASNMGARDNSNSSSSEIDSSFLDGNFCIIETRDNVKDFGNMQLDEISANIASRRNKIFLLMEEVRRLRIQQRLKGGDVPPQLEIEQEQYLSTLPFLPPLTDKTMKTYYAFYGVFFMSVIIFGGVLAPLLELKLGVGGTSYLDFVQSLALPVQLARVDPIVASFCGGAVGVVSALLLIEVSNVKKQQQNRCHYCEGTGYLACGQCVGSGVDPATKCGCITCSSTGKVMCPGCLCTGKQLATEHDPRLDPLQ